MVEINDEFDGYKRICVIHNVVIYANLGACLSPVVLSLLYSTICGGMFFACLCTLAVICSMIGHELSHVYIANKYGGVLDTLVLHGNGMAVRTIFEDDVTTSHRAIQALAGPVFNICIFIASVILYYITLPDMTHGYGVVLFIIMCFNILIFVVNMLPMGSNDGIHVYNYIKSVM